MNSNKKLFLFGVVFFLGLSVTNPAVRPVSASMENYTFKLLQSTASHEIWTTTPAQKVFKDSPVPTETGSGIKVYAAKNEYEPFQVVVKPAASGSVAVTIGDFGEGIATEIFQVKYVPITTPTDYFGRTGDNPDPLWPVSGGDSIPVTADQNTAFWFNVYVPKTASTGEHTATVQVGGISIPITLHVFNFAVPDDVHVKSQMNLSHNAILTKYSVQGTGAEYWMYVNKIKQFMMDHRLTPKSALWSGGLTTNGGAPYIDYDCDQQTLTDNDGIWGFEIPADNYLNGTALKNQTGFPSFMAATFQNNDASADQRPGIFCNETRSAADWYTGMNPDTAYNQQWFAYIRTVQNYLSTLNYLDKAYYYFANEPQDQADYDAVAWYSQELKNAAPGLKLMVSEEPKPEIYNHPVHTGAKIDIWMAHLGLQFNPGISWERMAQHNEDTWIYFLHGTRLPRFNPITIDHPGVEGKLLGWFLWKYRVRGIGYYAFNSWSPNPWTTPLNSGQNGNLFLMYPPSENNANISYGENGHRLVPSIRLEMIRDGLEDYEYFYLLNNGSQPQPYQTNPADATVDKVIGYTVAYSRDSEFIYNLRRVVGLKIGGEITDIPDLSPASVHTRSEGAPGNYYINFQDPAGEPAGEVIHNGHTYMKIGDELYNSNDGYGWIKAAEVPDSDFYPNWDPWIDPEPKALLGSSVIDSWGREDVFEFDLPNGIYNVTACAGSRSIPRYQNIVIEGTVFMDDEMTGNSWITRTKQVVVRDKKLTLVMGKYEKIGYINYLDIEAANTADVNCDGVTALEDVILLLKILSGMTPDLSSCTGMSGDVNQDGVLGMQDCIHLMRIISGNSQ